MTTVSNERLADAEWLEEAARYFERRDTSGEDMAFWANVMNAERCRSIAQSLRAQGGVSEYAADREILFQAASDPSLSDASVRQLCLAKLGPVTSEVIDWADATLAAKGGQ